MAIKFIIILTSLLFSNSLFAKANLDKTKGASIAYFAGGCFWCSEADLEKMKGVNEVISGYSGGDEVNPTYEEVSSKKTGHIESVKVFYDSDKIDYKTLLQKFLLTVDVTDSVGQFVDRGPQYRPAIFYQTNDQKIIIDEVLSYLKENKPFDKPVVIDVLKFKSFYDAEDYHQDYYKGKLSSLKYRYYRAASGRNATLSKLWKNFKFENKKNLEKKPSSEDTNKKDETNSDLKDKSLTKINKAPWKGCKKPSVEELKKKLTEEQFKVTQKDGTEPPFKNAYDKNKQAGIYVDIVCGEPLFSSKDKYDSGTGWPSFSKPISEKFIETKLDFKMIIPRTEVRSKIADSHIGHVFKDGPATTGLRYCMNSAAMRFIPKEKMAEEGYEEFLKYL